MHITGVNKILKKIVLKAAKYFRKYKKKFNKILLPIFANDQTNLVIEPPYKIIGASRIFMGNDVRLGPNSFLYIKRKFHESNAPEKHQRERKQVFSPVIIIGNRVRSRSGLQIAAMKRIEIGDDVILSANIFITDGSHGFESAEEPYRYQPMAGIKPVEIKKGCWIGQNVVILPGVTIGEYSIIGANSVVNKDIPPRTISVGAPAMVIKEWEKKTSSWVNVNKDLADQIAE